MDKVGELEDMVRKNSEYQKLLQNKIKEMQNAESQKEKEAAGREQELIERMRELEDQVKDQVGSPSNWPCTRYHSCSLVRWTSTV